MATFLISPVESCGGCHGVYSREEEVSLPTPNKGKGGDHGHLPPFLSRELGGGLGIF